MPDGMCMLEDCVGNEERVKREVEFSYKVGKPWEKESVCFLSK